MRAVQLMVVGAQGRLGSRLRALSSEVTGVHYAHGITGPDASWAELPPVDVVVDVSVKHQLPATVQWCVAHHVPLVVGTTGLDANDHACLDEAARHIPLLVASNFSVGVHALLAAASTLTKMLGDGFDLEVVEAHHRHKVDSPSGTARSIISTLRDARGEARSPDEASVHRPQGQLGPRGDDEIGVSVVRGGDVVGTHSVHFLGSGESLTLTHQATDRDIFARGALTAAQWIARTERIAGRYEMSDVILSRRP